MKWIVSGTWDHTNEPGSMTLTAASQAEAIAAAKARGLTVVEAMGVGAPPAAAATAAPPTKAAASRPKPAQPPQAGRAPRSPLRAKAARLAVASSSPAAALMATVGGLVVIVVGTYLSYELGPENWTGELIQIAGAVILVLGLRALDA